MPTKRKLSLDAEIADLAKREDEAARKRDKALAVRGMNVYTDLATKLRRYIESSGYDLDVTEDTREAF